MTPYDVFLLFSVAVMVLFGIGLMINIITED